MSDKESDFLLKRLSAWGIKRIYGYPGDGINGTSVSKTKEEKYE